MKTEFQARPVYLSREDRIQAHFLICYLSLMIYRILEKAERKIHSRKDHNSTKKNGITYHPRNRISAFLYKNWPYWWASWNIWIQYRLSDHDKEQHQKYHQTYKTEIINYVISAQNKNSQNLALISHFQTVFSSWTVKDGIYTLVSKNAIYTGSVNICSLLPTL